MTKKRNRAGVLLIGLFAVILMGVVVYNQAFSVGDLSSDVVYTPVFSHTECAVIASGYTETYDWYERDDDNGWITEYCSRNDHEVYTDKCDLRFNRADQGFFTLKAEIKTVYVCPLSVSFSKKNSDDCRKIDGALGAISFSRDEVVYAQATDLIGGVDKDEIQIKKVADWYGLRNVDSNNYLSKGVTCDVSRIKDRGFTFLKEEKEKKAPSGVLPFNSVMNYISAQSPTISKNIISYKGEAVWTVGAGEVCNLAYDDNGIKFVNLQDCYSAPDVICNPALPYCSDDGTSLTSIDASDKSCDEVYGSFLNDYIPAAKDPTTVCQYTCSGGVLKPVSCKKIPECKVGVLNDDYECVTANVPRDVAGFGVDPTLLFILLGFVVVILLMIVVRIMRDKGGRRK